MDDTHVDLIFDESTGRSVPTTPRSRTPPSITIHSEQSDSTSVTVAGGTVVSPATSSGKNAQNWHRTFTCNI